MTDSIEQIRAEVLAPCTKCLRLVQSRKRIAFSVGTGANRIMMIGEAPSQVGGNLTGKPMSDGKSSSGALMKEIIEENSISWDNCYITNVLFCSPPNNESPLPSEVKSCYQYTLREMEIIKPGLIIALGRIASIELLGGTYTKGTPYKRGNIVVVSMYHPSFILRKSQNDSSYKYQYKEDFKRILEPYRKLAQWNQTI